MSHRIEIIEIPKLISPSVISLAILLTYGCSGHGPRFFSIDFLSGDVFEGKSTQLFLFFFLLASNT